MEKTILAQFDYNGKTYVYYALADKPQNLLYGYIDDGEIKPVLSDDIIKLMNNVAAKIFISANPINYVKLTRIKFRNKLFQIMYDKSTKLKFFLEIKDNTFLSPNKEDVTALFNIYNKQIFYLTGEGKTDKTTKILRMVLIGEAFIIVTLTSLFICRKVEAHQAAISEQVVATAAPTLAPKMDFSLEKLIQALESNSNLSKEEKEFFIDILIKCQKYGPYMDMETLILRLSTFTLEYARSIGMVGGYVDYANNKININANDFSWCNKNNLTHEFIHFLSTGNFSAGYALEEAIAENVTCDLCQSISGNYFQTCAYSDILCEIIGPEPLAAFHFSGDVSYVINALKKIIPDEDLAFQLLSSLDDFHIQENFMIFYGANPNYPGADFTPEEREEIINNAEEFIYQTIAKYFLAAKGYPMEEDIIIRSYTKSFDNNDGDIYVSVDGTDESLIPENKLWINKNYFFADETVDLSLSIGSYNNGDYSEYKYAINDENRRLYPSLINPNALVWQSTIVNYEKITK